MLFAHITSRVDGEPYPTLLQDSDFGGVPSLAFMDSRGTVLATVRARTVEGFASTLRLVRSWLELTDQRAAGDESVATALFLLELELEKLDFEEAAERSRELGDVTPAQRRRIDGHLARLEASSRLDAARAAMRAGDYDAAAARCREVLAGDANHRRALMDLGTALLSARKLDQAIAVHSKLARLDRSRRADATYSVACAYALKGEADRAFEWLHESIKAGYTNVPWMKVDSDLDSLHGDPRFDEVIAAMTKAMHGK